VSDASTRAALDKLAKWRKFFASWQLGTVPAGDGRYRAVAHHRELSIIMRAEVNALTGLLIRKGLITQEEFTAALETEARQLDHAYEETYPGFRTVPDGLHMRLPEARETMRNLGFPP
jgi:hypothetical protein